MQVLIRNAVSLCSAAISLGSRRFICIAFLTLYAQWAQPDFSLLELNVIRLRSEEEMMNGDITLENTSLMTAYLNDIRGLEYSMGNKCRLSLSISY